MRDRSGRSDRSDDSDDDSGRSYDSSERSDRSDDRSDRSGRSDRSDDRSDRSDDDDRSDRSDDSDDSDDIFAEVFEREPYDDEDQIDESGRRAQGGGGALTDTSGYNDIDRGDPNQGGRRDHKYTTADMKPTPCWQRCLKWLFILLILIGIMILLSWLMQKIFFSEELKPDDYDEQQSSAGPDDGSRSNEPNSIMPKGRAYVEDVCSADKISSSERVFCETVCEPYMECCSDMFVRQNGTCYAKEVSGCYSYSKCQALSDYAVVDPAPGNLDRICDPMAIDVNPSECVAMCSSMRCCWDDTVASCLNTQFEACQDYSFCQNLRGVLTKKQVVPVANTDLDINCKRGSPICKRECYDARCCADEFSDCYRNNFIACLSYSSCNFMDDTTVNVNVPALNSEVSPAPSDLTSVCSPHRIKTNKRTCEMACDLTKCCWSSGKDNCFGKDPLGCMEYAPCRSLYNNTSTVVDPMKLIERKKRKRESAPPTEAPEPGRFEHNREFIMNMCGQVELDDRSDRQDCAEFCQTTAGCCDPFASDTDFECYAKEVGGCYAYSRCHAVASDDALPPAPDTLDRTCDLNGLKTGSSLSECQSECQSVACCWNYMDGSIPPCLDTNYQVCQDYLHCQNLKAVYILEKAGELQTSSIDESATNATEGTSSGGGGENAGTANSGGGGAGQANIGGGGGGGGNSGATNSGGGGGGGGGRRRRRLRSLQGKGKNVKPASDDDDALDFNEKKNRTKIPSPLVIPVASNDLGQACEDETEECTNACKEVEPCCNNPFSRCYRDNFMSCLSYAACPSRTTASFLGEIHSVLPSPSTDERRDIEEKCSYQAIVAADSISQCEAVCEKARCCYETNDLDDYCFVSDPLGCLQYFGCHILFELHNIPHLAHLKLPPWNKTVPATAEPKVPPGTNDEMPEVHLPNLLGPNMTGNETNTSLAANQSVAMNETQEEVELETLVPKKPKQFAHHREKLNSICSKENIGSTIKGVAGKDPGPCLTACQEAQYEECCNPFLKDSFTCFNEEGCYSYARCHSIIDGDFDPPPNDLARLCDVTTIQVDPTECLAVCEAIRCCWDDSIGFCWPKHMETCLDYSACQNLRNVLPPKGLEGTGTSETIMRQAHFLPMAKPGLDAECAKNSTECHEECSKVKSCCANKNDRQCFRDNFISCMSYSPCKQEQNIPSVNVPFPVIHNSIKHVKSKDINAVCTPGAKYDKEECDAICAPSACCFMNPAVDGCFQDDPFACLEYTLCETHVKFPLNGQTSV